MFVGRERELTALRRMYEKDGFQMAVIYGRRRVGKTTLIDEFVRDKRTLFFTAQQKTSRQNLELFSAAVYAAFSLPESLPAFSTWNAALAFVVEKVSSEPSSAPLVFVFDEFPYAAEADPSLPSAFQSAIDHGFKQTNARLILCGSNEGFMESEVLGAKSPLYGRRTMQVHLRPFDFLDAARMLPGLPPEEELAYYATFGGTPYYLSQVDRNLSYGENVRALLFDTTGMLYEEPLMLLRQELHEPALYNSILDAVGAGNTAPTRIAEQAGVNPNSVGKYLRTLISLGIVEKVAPFGEGESSRRARYRIKDPFFSYWYRFVSRYVGSIEEGVGAAVAGYATSGPAFATYLGGQFELVCLQWLRRESAAGRLPFAALEFGQWWGTDPSAREETDIDVIAANRTERKLLVGECKWRNSFDETAAIEALEHRATLLRGFARCYHVLFAKNDVSVGTREKAAKRDDLSVVTVADLYREPQGA
ncbi:MAG: ATP-binding protein [Coriobacteriales bacterium]|jgi:AAA+ ATPase superfamily predicted ATPase